jgi:hypothetical protein
MLLALFLRVTNRFTALSAFAWARTPLHPISPGPEYDNQPDEWGVSPFPNRASSHPGDGHKSRQSGPFDIDEYLEARDSR